MIFQEAETDSDSQLLDRALPAIARLESSLSDERERLCQAVHSENLLDALTTLGRAIAKERERLDAVDLIAPGGWEYEEFHSRIIGWLLCPSAHHRQAESFIVALLEATDAPQGLLDADWSAAQVRREWRNVVDGQEGFLDILVLNRDCRSLIAIENKTFSQEHSNQLTRYRRALAKAYPAFAKHHIFLSPDGLPPNEERDRKLWQPVSYSVIHDAIRGVLETGGVADPDAKALLQIYATTIRRNLMPDSNLDQQARRIYLEHREAIERIIANKPNWRDETKPILREAIEKHPDWKLESETNNAVRFSAAHWEEFPSIMTSTGSVIRFRFGFVSRSGIQMPHLEVALSDAGSEYAEIRYALFEAARQNPSVFRSTSNDFTDGFMRLHQELDCILEPADYGPGWDDGAARRKIEAWIDKFATEQFPEMNRIIIDCLRQHQEA